MAIDPSVVDAIDLNAHPAFTRVPTDLYENGVKVINYEDAGHIGVKVETHRDALQAKMTAAPLNLRATVSLYTAAKLVQLKTVDLVLMRSAIKQAHAAYLDAKAASGLGNPSQALVVALGAVFLDALADDMVAAPATEQRFADDFFLDKDENSPERKAIRAFANDTRVDTARADLRSASDWRWGCDEVYRFYEDFKRATL